jgi:hypothetical protein
VNFSKHTIGGEQPPRPDGEYVRPHEAAVAEAEGQLVGLSPFTVLLLSSDRNFRIVISLLLTRRGCTVIAGRLSEPHRREPAGHQTPDVVLIDAGQSTATITRSVEFAQTLPPSVGVVVVACAERLDAHGLPLLARWGPFPELYAAIQAADKRRRVDCG